MRDNGTEYSSYVASSKCYHKLLRLRALITGLWYNISENMNSKVQSINTANMTT